MCIFFHLYAHIGACRIETFVFVVIGQLHIFMLNSKWATNTWCCVKQHRWPPDTDKQSLLFWDEQHEFLCRCLIRNEQKVWQDDLQYRSAQSDLTPVGDPDFFTVTAVLMVLVLQVVPETPGWGVLSPWWQGSVTGLGCPVTLVTGCLTKSVRLTHHIQLWSWTGKESLEESDQVRETDTSKCVWQQR